MKDYTVAEARREAYTNGMVPRKAEVVPYGWLREYRGTVVTQLGQFECELSDFYDEEEYTDE